MQTAAAELKPKQRSTPAFSFGLEPHVRGVDADAGASAGMPNFLQRKSNGGDKSHSTGMDSSEEERQRLLDEEELPAPIQKKLVVGAADDPLEREADRVAQSATAQRSSNQVANVQRKANDQETCSCGGSCDACAAKGKLQRSSNRSSSSPSVPAAPAHLPSGEGAPLSGQVRERVEPVLGADLSGVRVHAGPQAARSARALNARAYTHQNHIWLGPSQSPDDVELIAHEATHVVQQRAARSLDGLVQRRPEDYEHPEDGATVQQQMGEQVAKATEGDDGGGGDAADSDGGTDSSTTSAEARSAAQTVSPEEREEKKGELEPYSKPPVDRPAAAQPQVASAADEVKSEADQPSEPLAEGQEKTPEGGEKGASAQADNAAALGAAAFAQAAAETMPDTPASVLPPAPIAPVNAEGEMVQPDPVADDAAVQLATEVQRMRNEGLIARQRATGLRSNADRLRGNLRIARGATDTAEQGLTKAQTHVESRREIALQARDALAVSEEKAATVAAQAPEYANRATQTHEDSGPMATEAQAKAGESGANSPDDEEAAGKMQEASGQMSQVGSDATSVDNAVTGTQVKGEALMADAAQAQEKNTATAGKLDATDEAIEQTDGRLSELDAQNEAARARIAGVEQGPAQLNAGAASVDAQAVAVLAASDDLEAQIHSAQDEFDTDMRGIPGSKAVAAVAEQASPARVVQRDAESAYGDRERVDVLGMFRGPASAAEREEQAQRAQSAAERRRQRLQEINERANGHFENLSATDKMGIALDIMGENLMGDLGNARWPNILGQMALAFVDPLVSLEGVVSGLNMTLSGAANLLSLEQWSRDPLGNLLKSSADIATGLTIILGSIAGLCTAILVILGALAIITFGAMGPAFAAASAFLGPIITTVGGWAISCAAIAAELQFYVLIKNLVDAATATTAEGLEHESDQMTEDATQAANMAAQVVTAGVMEAGGAALAETAVGQRLGAMATSVGERFDMIPPPRGAPVLEPGVTTPPETPSVVTAETTTVPPEASPPSAPASDVAPASAAPAAADVPPPAPADAPTPAQQPAAASPAASEAPAASPTSDVAPAPRAEAPVAPADSPAPASTPAAESSTPPAPGEPTVSAPESAAAPQEEPLPSAERPTSELPSSGERLSPDEQAHLDNTATKGQGELTPDELRTDRAIADETPARPIDEPPFTTERELPNGHEWKETEQGVGCRFSLISNDCLGPGGDPVTRPEAEQPSTTNPEGTPPVEGTGTTPVAGAKVQRPIPEGGLPIDSPGLNPPERLLADPERYYYNPENGQYMRRPEPAPPFRPEPNPPTGVRVDRPIPEGGLPIDSEGLNPPDKMLTEPDLYYYDPETGTYNRRPEPAPPFRAPGAADPRAIPCFPAGTLVATPHGTVPIESLGVGGEVIACEVNSGTTSAREITATHRNRTVRLVDISIDAEVISATVQHRFWVDGSRRWVPASLLEAGMDLRSADGTTRQIDSVNLRQVSECATFNLTVADIHTYFVGGARVLVHNAGESGGKVYIGRNPQGEIVYVGLTKDDLLDRQAAHRRDAINEPEKYGFKKDITLEVVDGMTGLSDDEMRWHERRVYDELKQQGHDLQNPLEETTTYEKLNELYEKYC